MNNLVLVGGLLGLAAIAGVPATTWLGTTRPQPLVSTDKALAATPAARLSEDDARHIAWRSGLDHIEEIMLSGERWEVAGRDRTGQEITLDIDAKDGRLLH
ncbi:hypothetical protein ASE63_09565 [Bosea sp. Root381]|uniref:PepSY domain-containing protein n=1 Tax=Bosea sp. Root381 TaxID=1736524 RepID=UPI0007160B2C|nr:PepSY domain-containing protein [Bosea sp. Root381]KRE00309.1 hypothetical protein ASE63_09565 [Bosea sp. Root381]